ncbi:motility associated factor glycosyltransferase family protein [Thermoanaerobacterium thermosulfurigenes]|uniref:motility associated factor glycosyltransferase family protein n=1 Tax=Thermoanaerobacterium thermosulfurigenes TaxID=33950 RepID=UPI003EF3E995
MSILEKNINCLNKNSGNKNIFDYLPKNIINVKAKNGLLTSEIVIDDKTYFIHSKYDPINEAKMLCDSLDYSKSTLIFVFGIGLAYHLFELKNRISLTSRVIVIETNLDIYYNALNTVDLTQLFESPQFIFIVGNENTVRKIISDLFITQFIFYAANIQVLALPSENIIYPEWKNLMEDIMNIIKEKLFIIGNDINDTLIGLRQNFANIKHIMNNPGVKLLKDSYKNKPAIIISSGPSLSKNIDFLKRAKGKALLLSVDASLNALFNKNIIPDAVFSIERGVETYNYFYKDKNIPEDIVLIAPPVIYPKIFDEYKGKKIICFKEGEAINEWLNNLFNDKGKFKMGTSVAHLAFGFAKYVGANPIIFVGQDLAYAPDGRTHSDGTVYEGKKDELVNNKEIVYVDDYNGRKIPSTRVWKNFLTWFENEILITQSKCIDATEGGAYIKGTEIMSLNDAIDKYCVDDIISINEFIDSINYKNDNLFKEEIEKNIKKARDLFEDLKKLSERRYEVTKTNEKKYINGNKVLCDYNKFLGKLKKNEEVVDLIQKNSLLMMFFQPIIVNTYFKVIKIGNVINDDILIKNLNIHKELLYKVINICSIIIEEFDKIIENII